MLSLNDLHAFVQSKGLQPYRFRQVYDHLLEQLEELSYWCIQNVSTDCKFLVAPMVIKHGNIN